MATKTLFFKEKMCSQIKNHDLIFTPKTLKGTVSQKSWQDECMGH
jgi:hypothetical protein